MANPVINQALKDLVATEQHITDAEELISIMAEAGQDVSKQRSELNKLKIDRQKYIDVLKAHGATTNG